MQNTFVDVFKYNFSGQIFARVISFLINLYLIRVVDPALLGLINVRMTLLYSTIVFMSKEPFRKVCLAPSISVKDAFSYSLLSPLLSLLLTVACTMVWWQLPDPELGLQGTTSWIILSFAASALLSGLAEPVVILAVKTGDNAHYSLANGVMTLAAKAVTLGLILLTTDTVYAFCLAQIFGSLLYVAVNIRYFLFRLLPLLESEKWREDFKIANYDKPQLLLIATMVFHSLLKQFINSGSEFVMTFTNVLPLKVQAVYDAVEKLIGLVVRVVLTPLEESAAVYFASNIRQQPHVGDRSVSQHFPVPTKVVRIFVALLRLTTIMGTIVCVFGFPYSRLAVQLYGGKLLVENDGAKFLSLYTVYLLLISINGITECFAFALMNTYQIFNHGAFLLCASTAHLLLNAVLCYVVGAPGFIAANCLSTLLRLAYNWRHIRRRLGDAQCPHLSELLPSFNLTVLLLFALFSTTMSFYLFGIVEGLLYGVAHVLVGGVMFLLVLVNLYQTEQRTVADFMEKSE